MTSNHDRSLSQSIVDMADAVEHLVIADGYAEATRFLRPLMRDVPDGRIAVGAMDGWTALVFEPAV
ncbi:hypothetical protein [Azospirillum endophyticum]